MKIIDIFRKYRDKFTSLNVILFRFDILQTKLDQVLNMTNSIASYNYSNKLISAQKLEENFLQASKQATPSCDNASVDEKNKEFNFIQKQSEEEKIRLVFLVLTPEIWPSIAPIWIQAQADERFVVSVVLLRIQNLDVALTSMVKARSSLEAAGIPYFTEKNFCIENYRPHVVIYPLPYGDLYPDKFKPELIAAKGYRIVYVPYGLEVGGGMFNSQYQYDTEVVRFAWRVFARSKKQLNSFGRYCAFNNGHVVVTGHPRSELGASHPATYPNHPIKIKAKGRSVILWTPHFSVSSRRKWSSFLDHHETILSLIDDRPELFLLVRPHPLLRTTLSKLEDWGPERVTAWFTEINERDNAYADTEADYRPAFEVSTALMADAGSFLVEYLRTEKPICYLTGKDDIGLNEEVRSLACFYPGATKADVAEFLDSVRNSDDPMFEVRKTAAQIYFGSNNCTPSQTILDEISNEICNPPQRLHSNKPPLISRHEEVFQYWVKQTTTFLAPESYYQESEIKLRDILSRHSKGGFAVDIGCGNGRFTEIFCEHFEFIEATDPNELLISEARKNAFEKGIANISYSVERLEHPKILSTYDFVSCMGVTSGLIDDEVFIKSIWKLKAAMRPGAKLLMKDSLSLSTPEWIEWDDYNAVYRNMHAYIAVFEAAGLTLLEELIITKDPEKGRINSFFIFKDAH